MSHSNDGALDREQLPSDCFTYRGKIKIRTALRYLYSTRDWIPSDARLCNLWATNEDPITPKRIGRERSRLAGVSGEGFSLEKTGAGKWRVIERPDDKDNGPGATDLFYDSRDDGAEAITSILFSDPDGMPGWFRSYALKIDRIYKDLVE